MPIDQNVISEGIDDHRGKRREHHDARPPDPGKITAQGVASERHDHAEHHNIEILNLQTQLFTFAFKAFSTHFVTCFDTSPPRPATSRISEEEV